MGTREEAEERGATAVKLGPAVRLRLVGAAEAAARAELPAALKAAARGKAVRDKAAEGRQLQERAAAPLEVGQAEAVQCLARTRSTC